MNASRPTHRRGAGLGLVVLLLSACTTTLAPPEPPVTVTAVTTVEPAETTQPAPVPPSWPDVFAEVRNGVARVAVTTCWGQSTGSAFVVGPNTAVTAAHVVEDAVSISVRLGAEVYSATTIGLNAADDLAFLQIGGFPTGHEFALASGPIRTAEEIGVLGFPYGLPLGMTNGTVTSEGLTIQVEGGSSREGVFRTSAVVNPGNSGGPVINAAGEVVGVVSAGDGQGNNYAMGWESVSAALMTWRAGDLAAVAPASCPERGEGERGGEVEMTISASSPEAPSVAQTFQLYANAINDHYIELAWEMLGPHMRAKAVDLDTYAEGLRTSSWLTLDLRDVRSVDDHTDTARAVFVTEQSAEYGPGGQTCSVWDVTYTLVLDQGFWQIDDARLTDGPATAC